MRYRSTKVTVRLVLLSNSGMAATATAETYC